MNGIIGQQLTLEERKRADKKDVEVEGYETWEAALKDGDASLKSSMLSIVVSSFKNIESDLAEYDGDHLLSRIQRPDHSSLPSHCPDSPRA